jgi:hypothetical protein
MAKKEYPYQNLSLEDQEGEEWEDIPGLDGYYLISNFGRIRRQQYEMQYRNGAIYIKPEKIIKPSVVKALNKFKKDFTCFLTGKVKVNGRKYGFMISRIVYYCFVEPFDMENRDVVIICNDTDNFNIYPSNLSMATRSQKQQRAVARKRFKSPFFDMTEEDRQKQRKGILKSLSKQVSQYNMKGRKIRTYQSAAVAQRVTGVFSTSIGKVTSGEGFTAGGYIWRLGKEPKVDVKAIKDERRRVFVKKHGQKVTQYDLTGKRIAHYPCVKDAAEASGAKETAINCVFKGVYKSAKGFFWKKGYGKDAIDLSNYKWGRQSMAETQSKPVKQFDLNEKYIQTFPSIKMAAKTIGVSPATLVGALKGSQHTSGGFKWKYA